MSAALTYFSHVQTYTPSCVLWLSRLACILKFLYVFSIVSVHQEFFICPFQSTTQYFVSCPHLLQSCTNVHSFVRSVAFASCLYLEISICFLHSVGNTKNFSYVCSNLLRNTLSAALTCFSHVQTYTPSRVLWLSRLACILKFLYVFYIVSITPRVFHMSFPIYYATLCQPPSLASVMYKRTLLRAFCGFRVSELLYVFFTMSMTPRVFHISIPTDSIG